MSTVDKIYPSEKNFYSEPSRKIFWVGLCLVVIFIILRSNKFIIESDVLVVGFILYNVLAIFTGRWWYLEISGIRRSSDFAYVLTGTKARITGLLVFSVLMWFFYPIFITYSIQAKSIVVVGGLILDSILYYFLP